MNNIIPKIETTQNANSMQRQTTSAINTTGTDPFLAIINRLVENMQQNGEDGVKKQTQEPETLALLAQFFAQMGNVTPEQTQVQQEQLNEANIANLVLDFEQLKNFMTQNNVQIPQVLQELTTMQTAQLQKEATPLTNNLNFENLVINEVVNTQEQNSNIVMFSTPSSSANAAEDQLFSEQHSFFKSIEAVKKDMNPQSTIDIEAILAQLNTPQEAQNTAANTAIVATNFELPVNNPELFNQLQVGLQDGVDAGLPQFTLKLNPQELGEITVKLFNDGSKQVLEIAVANSKTSLMINDDIDALRQAMAPLQIEVKEAVVTSTAQSGQSQMHDFNMNSGQFANRENQSQQTAQGYSYSGEFLAEEEQTLEQTFVDDTLNVYI